MHQVVQRCVAPETYDEVDGAAAAWRLAAEMLDQALGGDAFARAEFDKAVAQVRGSMSTWGSCVLHHTSNM